MRTGHDGHTRAGLLAALPVVASGASSAVLEWVEPIEEE
jgi:hypothetical protein